MAEHRAGGGLVIAATHQALGLHDAMELRIDRAVEAPATAFEAADAGVDMIRAGYALVARDLRLAARVGGSGTLSLVFFLMIVALVPFALGPDLTSCRGSGPPSSGSRPCSPR